MSDGNPMPPQDSNEREDGTQQPRPRNYTGLILVLLICTVCILVFNNTLKEPDKITFPEFLNKLAEGKIESVEIKKKVLTVSLKKSPNKGVQKKERVILPETFVAEQAILLEELASLGREIAPKSNEMEDALVGVLKDKEEPSFCVLKRYLIEENDRNRMLIKVTRPETSTPDSDPAREGAPVVFLLEPKVVETTDAGAAFNLTWAGLLRATATDDRNAEHGLPPVSDITVTLPMTKGTLGFVEDPSWVQTLLISLAPWVLMIFFFWFFIFRQMRNNGIGGNVLSFGRSRARLANREKSSVTFEDVAGIEEAKGEVGEIVEFLKHPGRFSRLGGRIPRGVLLVGPPGNGKTLLAKAIAGEADVPFFSISGSDFVEMFVGVGASRVRDLFKQARDNSPCIVFLDEIDAVGRRRGAGLGGGHDEREQTLNAILVEMDGFETDTGIIVIAATNRADVLDPALLRPGRFDRQIAVDLPDVKGRAAILGVHSRKVKMHPSVDLERVAKGTPGFSGAELESLINEAAIIAVMSKKDYIYEADLEEARDRVRWGRAKSSRIMDEKEKRVTAWHEAGHTLIAWLLPDADPPHKVTIVPRGRALGATMLLPEKDIYQLTLGKAEAQLKVMFGGRVAEELTFDDITSGAADDIKRASDLARHMVREWGMSEEIGPINFAENEDEVFLGKDIGRSSRFSEATIQAVDKEVKRIIDAAYEGTQKLLAENRDKLDLIAENLLKYEVLTREELDGILEGIPVEEVRRRESDARRAAEVIEPAPRQTPSPVEDDRGPALPPLAGEGAT